MALLLTKTIRLDLSALAVPPPTPLHLHPLVRAVGSNWRAQERNEIHYDTPDLALRSSNLAITLNRQDEHWIQRCSIHDDYENCRKWVETPIVASQLDLTAIKTTRKEFPAQAQTQLQHIAVEGLAPVFTLHCREEQWSLDFPDNVHIILREERGYLKFGVTRQPFHELVLELQSGSLARWFQTAMELAYFLAAGGKNELALACTTPVARGFAWLDPALLLPGRNTQEQTANKPISMPFALQANMTVRQAFGHICGKLLQRLQEYRCLTLYGSKQAKLDGVQWLYQTTSQLHTLTLLGHALLPTEIRLEIDKELRWLLKELDTVLEWQVFLRETLEPLLEQFRSHSGFEEPLAKAREGLQLAVKRLGKVLASFRYSRLILGLSGWVAGQSWEFWSDLAQQEGMEAPITAFATEMLQRHHSQLRKHSRKFSSMTLANRCELRHSFDLLWHTTSLFAELFANKRAPLFQASLQRLHDHLAMLLDLHASERFFARLVDKRQETVGHLIQGWQGARTNRRMFDSSREWELFMAEVSFW